MFRFISWSEFFSAIVLSCISYWAIIFLLYYRRELLDLFRPQTHPASPSYSQPIDPEEDLFDKCSHCAEVIKNLIRESSLKSINKKDLLAEIKNTLVTHHDFQNTVWEIPINNLIKFETAQHCAFILDDAEVKSVWES